MLSLIQESKVISSKKQLLQFSPILILRTPGITCKKNATYQRLHLGGKKNPKYLLNPKLPENNNNNSEVNDDKPSQRELSSHHFSCQC